MDPMVGKLRDMRDQSRRVLILGSGPLATTLIEEIGHLLNVSISKKATLKYRFSPEALPVATPASVVLSVT